MTENRILHAAMHYVRKHLIRFLLLAVILTAGLTLRMAAFAKYSSYLNDYTSAVAGDFFFTSDYLYAPEDRTAGSADYHINSWKGGDYEVEVEIRNFENSLRFNHTGTDFFYWVDVEVFTDAACTETDNRFRTYVTYPAVGATDADGKQYGFLPGISEFDHTSGTQTVKVKISPTTTIASGSCYMKVTAHTVPLAQVSALTLASGVSTETERGVYYATQEAVFFLNITSSTASITSDLNTGSGSGYTVRYRIICNSSEGGGGSVRVKAYYRSDRLIPDISLGNSYKDNTGDYAYSAAAPWRYVQTTINVGGSEDLYFYKASLSLSPAVGTADFAAIVLNTEDIDTTEYNITSAANLTGGAVSSLTTSAGTAVTQAAMGTRIYVTLTPNEGYMVYTFSVQDSILNPLTVTAAGENRYSFEMTNDNVVVTPAFVRKVMVEVTHGEDELGHGTVEPTPLGTTVGQTVYLTIKPDTGYELASLTLNGSSTGLSQLTDTLYSFQMPDAAVNVTASFTEVQQENE